MFLSIDLGGSTVDLVVFSEKNEIKRIYSVESNQVDKSDLDKILKISKLKISDIKKIYVTGGFSKKYPNQYKEIPIIKINEISAIGNGGIFLAGIAEGLVISMGTGTCMVSVKRVGRGIYCKHIGGTGVGGGTLIGLSKLMIKEKNALKIEKIAAKGNINRVNLSVEDIVGENIGIIPGSATASNFGKIDGSARKEDIASGICNLIGETIAGIAVFAAQMYEQKNIVLTGKLTRIKMISDVVRRTGRIYNCDIIVPNNCEYASAIGSGII